MKRRSHRRSKRVLNQLFIHTFPAQPYYLYVERIKVCVSFVFTVTAAFAIDVVFDTAAAVAVDVVFADIVVIVAVVGVGVLRYFFVVV